MADFNLVEEYIREACKLIGDFHDTIKFGIGDSESPGSALFELEQISSLTRTSLPKFGVLETPTSQDKDYFEIAPGDHNGTVIVNEGVVVSNGQRLRVNTQVIPYGRAFGSVYNQTAYENYRYGVEVGVRHNELEKASKLHTSTTSAAVSPENHVVYVSDTAIVSGLGFPLAAFIDNSFILFSNLDSATNALRIDPSYRVDALSSFGVAGKAYPKGVSITFLYTPKIESICGLPISSADSGASLNPASFEYFPPTPKGWLHLGRMVCVNPKNPTLGDYNDSPAILRTVVEYPDPQYTKPFDVEDVGVIGRSVDSLKRSFSDFRGTYSVSTAIQGIESYTKSKARPQESFRQFWANMPFKPTNYFARGTSFESLERFTFPESFKRAYFDTRGQDLHRTFAIFRGDLYDRKTLYTSSLVPQFGITGSYPAHGLASTLTAGTYSYSITAIDGNGSESLPKTKAINAPHTPYTVNHIKWGTVANASGYHIYRRINERGVQADVRITPPEGISAASVPEPTYINASANPEWLLLGTSVIAFKITNTSNTYLGGLALSLSVSNEINVNPDSKLVVNLYEDDNGAPDISNPVELKVNNPRIDYNANPNALKMNEIRYGDIGTDFSTAYIVKFDANLTDPVYWATLTVTAPMQYREYPSNTVDLAVLSIATEEDNSYTEEIRQGAAVDSTTYTVNHKVRFDTLGFVDNGLAGTGLINRGVKIFNEVALRPTSLRVFVPPLDKLSVTFDMFFSGESLYDVDPVTGEVSRKDNWATANEMIVTVIVKNGTNGLPITLTATVPKGTSRGTAIPLRRADGVTSNVVFDRVLEASVLPGSQLSYNSSQTGIQWSIRDLITIESVP
jgi:hypothetical protein